MTSTPPQPWAHRPGPRSRPSPAADPERAALGRSSRRRGAENEDRTFKLLVHRFYPRARRTRPGDPGADIYTEGVGHRALEFTVARWADIMIKLDQAASAARTAGTYEYAVIKPARTLPGQRRRWFAILDGHAYMRMARELDILRDLLAGVGAASEPYEALTAERLARLALSELEEISSDNERG